MAFDITDVPTDTAILALAVALYAAIRTTVNDIRGRRRILVELATANWWDHSEGHISNAELMLTIRSIGGTNIIKDVHIEWKTEKPVKKSFPPQLYRTRRLLMSSASDHVGTPLDYPAEATLGEGDVWRVRFHLYFDGDPFELVYTVRARVDRPNGKSKRTKWMNYSPPPKRAPSYITGE